MVNVTFHLDTGTKEQLYSTFVQRVRDNLHIVLCMSPVGDAFRSRCRQFPSLINCCTIDWFTEWPRAALLSVSEKFLAQVSFASGTSRLLEHHEWDGWMDG